MRDSYFQVNYVFFDEHHVSTINISCGYELLKTPDVFVRLRRVALKLGCDYVDPTEIITKPNPPV